MSFQPGGNLYPVAFGTRPEGVEVPHINTRNPTIYDRNFPVGKRWINTSTSQEWSLVGLYNTFTAGVPTLNADWILLNAGSTSGPLLTLSDTSNTVVYPSADNALPPGNIQFTSTDGSMVITGGTNTIDFAVNPVDIFQPNKVLTLVDDFIPNNGANTNQYGQLKWAAIASADYRNSTEANRPGILAIENLGSPNGLVLSNPLGTPFITGSIILGAGVLTYNYVVKLSALSTLADRYIIKIGLGNTDYSGTPITDGVYFSYTDNANSGKWTINTMASSVTTTTNTTSTADTNWHNFSFVVNSAASSITYYIDGISVGTITTHIPTAAVLPMIYIDVSSGIQPDIFVDLFYLSYQLTNAR